MRPFRCTTLAERSVPRTASTFLFGVPSEKVLLTGTPHPTRESESSRRFSGVSVRNVTFLLGVPKTRFRTESARPVSQTRDFSLEKRESPPLSVSESSVNPSAGQFRDWKVISAGRTRTYNIPVNSRMLYH